MPENAPLQLCPPFLPPLHIPLQPSCWHLPAPLPGRGARSCAGIHGVWSTGKRLLMCSTAHAWLAGRPCPPSPAPHVGKRIGMLRGCSGNVRRGCSRSAWGCSRGCSGGTQRMPRGMPRRVWSIQQPNTLLRSRDHLAWGAAGSHRSPGSRLGSEEGTGRQRGSLLPPGTPTAPDGAPCCSAAAPAPLPPGELAEGMPTFTLPSSQRPLRLLQARLPGQRAGCAVGRSNNPLLCCWGAARGAGIPRNSGQWGGRAPTAWGPRWALDPCKAGEAPLPPRVMSQAGIPVSGWGGTLGTQVLAKPGRHRRLVG